MRKRFRRVTWAVAWLLGAWVSAADAAQHLVSPGDNWSALATKIRPGDEVLLMPGKHRGALLLDLVGTADAPIVIRSLDPQRPAVINEQREGLRLVDCMHVQVRDVTISGSTVNGLAIVDRAAHPSPLPLMEAGRRSGSSHIVIERLLIERTGPTGLRHALLLHNASHVEVRTTLIKGWAGSALDVAASRDVAVRDCRFEGLEGSSQIAGVRVRAGSQRVHVDHCRFAGTSAAFCFGGQSDKDDWRTPEGMVVTTPVESAGPGPSNEHADARAGDLSGPGSRERAEAIDCIMERCIVERGDRPIVFQAASGCMVRNNTMVDVRRSILVVIPPPQRGAEHSAAGAAPNLHQGSGTSAVEPCLVTANIFTWQTGNLQALAEFEAGADNGWLNIGQNLWWSPEDAQARSKLGELPGSVAAEQVVDVDPALDSGFQPRTWLADLFGIHAP